MGDTIRNVISEVVHRELCAGCGICAGICPRECLRMQFNGFGEYTPTNISPSCASQCSLCLQSCPFYDGNPNEDELAADLFADLERIMHRPETGYYLKTWAGFCSDERQRLRSGSGGLATWVQCQLLQQGLVDAVISVKSCCGPERLFQYTISTIEREVELCSRSAYYPVHLAEVVRHILAVPGKYAVIGLPCAVKALRLAGRCSRRLQERIQVHLGLVCEMSRSRAYGEYLCALAGGVPDTLEQIRFRVKSQDYSVTDYGISLEWKSGSSERVSKMIRRSQYYERLNGRYFVPNACSFCDDTFCETADVVFMDAWLPECTDYRGTSLVLARTPLIAEVIERGATNSQLQLEPVSIEKTLQSQFSVVRKKRGLMHGVSAFARRKGRYVPHKRTLLPGMGPSFWDKQLAVANYELAVASRRLWPECGKNADLFWQRIQRLAGKVRILARFRLAYSKPGYAAKRLLRVFQAR